MFWGFGLVEPGGEGLVVFSVKDKELKFSEGVRGREPVLEFGVTVPFSILYAIEYV